MPRVDNEIDGFLGKGLSFEGQIECKGTLRIDGAVKGKINATGAVLLGESARVVAEIQCSSLIVHGEITGNVQATKRFEAVPPARIQGDIRTQVLVINEGVFFDGRVKMGPPGEKEELEKKTRLFGRGKELELKEERKDSKGD